MTLRRLVPTLLILIAPAACQGQEGDWVSLFDGQSMDGWEMLKLDPNNDSRWTVEDGALVGRGAASMLFSPEVEAQNYRVRAEIQINDGGNSGMYFRCVKEPSFAVGYEAQINSTHGDPIKTGSIYTRVHVYKELVPPDTWFTQEIQVVDRRYRGRLVTAITVSVDGEVLYEFLDYDRQHSGSYLAFQQHDPGSVVKIRKVEVMPLPATTE